MKTNTNYFLNLKKLLCFSKLDIKKIIQKKNYIFIFNNNIWFIIKVSKNKNIMKKILNFNNSNFYKCNICEYFIKIILEDNNIKKYYYFDKIKLRLLKFKDLDYSYEIQSFGIFSKYIFIENNNNFYSFSRYCDLESKNYITFNKINNAKTIYKRTYNYIKYIINNIIYHWYIYKNILKELKFINNKNLILSEFKEYRTILRIKVNFKNYLYIRLKNLKLINFGLNKSDKILDIKAYEFFYKIWLRNCVKIYDLKFNLITFKGLGITDKISDIVGFNNIYRVTINKNYDVYFDFNKNKINFNGININDKITDFINFKNFIFIKINHSKNIFFENKIFKPFTFKNIGFFDVIIEIKEIYSIIRFNILKKEYLYYNINNFNIINFSNIKKTDIINKITNLNSIICFEVNSNKLIFLKKKNLFQYTYPSIEIIKYKKFWHYIVISHYNKNLIYNIKKNSISNYSINKRIFVTKYFTIIKEKYKVNLLKLSNLNNLGFFIN